MTIAGMRTLKVVVPAKAGIGQPVAEDQASGEADGGNAGESP